MQREKLAGTGEIEERKNETLSIFEALIERSRTLNFSSFVLFIYTLFLAGFFFVPNAVDLYKFFMLAVLVPGLVYSLRTVPLIGRSKVWLATLLCLAYMLLTSFWSRDFSGGTLWYDARLTAGVLVFLLVTVTIGLRKSGDLDLAIRLACVCAAVSAVISIPYWYWQHPSPDARLVSIGIFTSPNHSSFVYGFFCLLSGYYVVQAASRADRALYLILTVTLLVFVILTQSRTGILATLFSFLLLVTFSPRNKKAAFGVAVVIGMMFVFFQVVAPGMLSRLNEVSISNRIEIWKQALDAFVASPYFGQGYQTGFEATVPGLKNVFLSAHNTFIATLRDGGLIGLVFQLYMLVAAVRVGLVELAKRDNPLYLVLLVFSLMCMSTATDRLITRPRELWILLWLPLALLIIRELRNASGTASETGAASDKGVC